MPANFSAAYAFAFCAGVYFRGAMAWWLPLGTMLATDVALNVFYYHVAPFAFYLLLNYAIFAAAHRLGQMVWPPRIVFQIAAGRPARRGDFLSRHQHARVAARPGLRQNDCRLDSGADHRPAGLQPTTWEMFRNTLLSGGLFTALFVAAEKLTAPAESPADKTAGARDRNRGIRSRGSAGGGKSVTSGAWQVTRLQSPSSGIFLSLVTFHLSLP